MARPLTSVGPDSWHGVPRGSRWVVTGIRVCRTRSNLQIDGHPQGWQPTLDPLGRPRAQFRSGRRGRDRVHDQRRHDQGHSNPARWTSGDVFHDERPPFALVTVTGRTTTTTEPEQRLEVGTRIDGRTRALSRLRHTVAAIRASDDNRARDPRSSDRQVRYRRFRLTFRWLRAQSSSLRALMKTSPGTSTRPIDFIFFLPSFCFSSSLRLRLMSPP